MNKAYYQTKVPKLAHALKKEGFDYTLKNNIYEFEYDNSFRIVKDRLLGISPDEFSCQGKQNKGLDIVGLFKIQKAWM